MNKVSLKFQLGSALCGVIMFVIYPYFWGVLGHMLPPPSPAWSPAQLAANYFNKYHDDIMVGMLGSAVIGMLWLPFASQVFVTMTSREHSSRVLGLTQFFAGGLTAWAMVSCPARWALAAHYAATDPATAQSIWLGEWYIYDCTYMITALQVWPFALYVLSDRSGAPICPRWVGWYSLLVGVVYIPLSLMPFFQTGPFAYNGLWNFWIVYIVGYVWYPIVAYFLITDLIGQLRTEATAGSAASASGLI